MAQSEVAQAAARHALPLLKPTTLKSGEAQEAISRAACDAVVVAAFGMILPRAILAIPSRGCLNIHASLLPRWRGAAPIQRAILAGDRETGVSIMQMDAGLDTGDVLLKRATPIAPDESAGALHDRLAELGAHALLEVLARLPDLKRVPQPAAGVTYADKLSKEEAVLDWRRPAAELARAVRAYNPWPVAHTLHQGKPLRVWRATVVGADAGEPGTVLAAGRQGIDVATGAGVLRLLEVQPAGGKPVAAADFANGRRLAGARFG